MNLKTAILLMNMAFLAIFNLMQKIISTFSFIYDIQSIFQNFWPEILTIIKVLAKTTRGPVHYSYSVHL